MARSYEVEVFVGHQTHSCSGPSVTFKKPLWPTSQNACLPLNNIVNQF